jgi:hypothetical protein
MLFHLIDKHEGMLTSKFLCLPLVWVAGLLAVLAMPQHPSLRTPVHLPCFSRSCCMHAAPVCPPVGFVAAGYLPP